MVTPQPCGLAVTPTTDDGDALGRHLDAAALLVATAISKYPPAAAAALIDATNAGAIVTLTTTIMPVTSVRIAMTGDDGQAVEIARIGTRSDG